MSINIRLIEETVLSRYAVFCQCNILQSVKLNKQKGKL